MARVVVLYKTFIPPLFLAPFLTLTLISPNSPEPRAFQVSTILTFTVVLSAYSGLLYFYLCYICQHSHLFSSINVSKSYIFVVLCLFFFVLLHNYIQVKHITSGSLVEFRECIPVLSLPFCPTRPVNVLEFILNRDVF